MAKNLTLGENYISEIDLIDSDGNTVLLANLETLSIQIRQYNRVLDTFVYKTQLLSNSEFDDATIWTNGSTGETLWVIIGGAATVALGMVFEATLHLIQTITGAVAGKYLLVSERTLSNVSGDVVNLDFQFYDADDNLIAFFQDVGVANGTVAISYEFTVLVPVTRIEVDATLDSGATINLSVPFVRLYGPTDTKLQAGSTTSKLYIEISQALSALLREGKVYARAVSGDTNALYTVDGKRISLPDYHILTMYSEVPADDDTVTTVIDHSRGFYDLSTNVAPSTGGAGTGGAILDGDYWFASPGGILFGTPYPINTKLQAIINNPGQTQGNWHITSSEA